MLALSLLVCFQLFLVEMMDSQQRPWIVVYFVFAGVAAGCLVFLFLFSVSSSLSLSPGPVQLYDMLYFVHKN